MASITIRDIPDDLFDRCKDMAREDRRSINAEVIDMLEKAVQMRDLKKQRLSALEEIDRIRASQPASSEQDTLDILREGRQR